MSTDYIDAAELAARIPDGHPYKARALLANEKRREEAEEALYRDLSAASGLADWLSSRGLDVSEHPGGDAPVRDDYPGDNLSADLSERQPGQPLSVEDLLKIAREDSDDHLPEGLREDAELQEALRRQSHEDAFGGPDPSDSMTDDELWAALSPDMRGEEGGFGDG